MKIIFPTSYMIGLVAYLRQSALSLDRTQGPNFREELRKYYDEHEIPSPAEVLSSIKQYVRQSSLPIRTALERQHSTCAVTVVSRIQKAIELLEDLLSCEKDFSVDDKRKLRVELSRIEQLLAERLSRDAKDRTRKVEHLNQNDRLSLKSLGEIAGEEWPGMTNAQSYVPNSTPVGRRSSPGANGPDAPQSNGAGRHNPEHVNGSIQKVQNLPGLVNGREFSGHAFDQMRNRGLTPTVVENAIRTGEQIPGNTPGTSVFVDSVNSVRVIVNKAVRVVTVE